MLRTFHKLSVMDAIAGLSVAGVLLPASVAYAAIANLPPQTGIIGMLVGLVCYGIFGASRFAIVSPTSSAAMIMAVAIASFAAGDDALQKMIPVALVLMTGAFFLFAAAAKLGNITDFIAKPALKGFTFGLVVIIAAKQFASIVGVPTSGISLYPTAKALLLHINHWNWNGLAIGAGALGILFLCRRFKYVPGGLVVIALGILLSRFVDLSTRGILLVGEIDLSSLNILFPTLDRIQWLNLVKIALALAMVLYSESYGSIRSFALKHGDATSPNRDLFALGLSNVLSGLFGGMPSGAGYSQTAANEAAGATSRWSGVISAVVLLGIILAFLQVVALTPYPVLAAIVIYSVSDTLRPEALRPYFAWKRDRLVVVTAVIGVFIFGVLDGLLAAIAMSIVLLLRRFSETNISVLGRLGNTHDFVPLSLETHTQTVDGILILRPEQPLFFANCEQILNHIRDKITAEEEQIHSIIISMGASPDVDSSTLESFHDFFVSLEETPKRLVFARLKEPAYQALSKILPPGTTAITLSYRSVDDAVNFCQANHR